MSSPDSTGIDCNVWQARMAESLDACQRATLGATSTVESSIPAELVALVVAITLGLLALCVLVGYIAFKIGYRRACEDMSVYRPTSIIKR